MTVSLSVVSLLSFFVLPMNPLVSPQRGESKNKRTCGMKKTRTEVHDRDNLIMYVTFLLLFPTVMSFYRINEGVVSLH